jgi:hypothetical protein
MDPAPAVFRGCSRWRCCKAIPATALFTVRLHFQMDTRSSRTRLTRMLTVVSGTFVVGMGSAFDKALRQR